MTIEYGFAGGGTIQGLLAFIFVLITA